MPVARAHLEVLADLVAGAAGHHGIGQHDVGIDIIQADQRGIGVADGDDFVAFFAEDALAHALGVRAVVHQQNTAHCFAGDVGCLSAGRRGGRLRLLVFLLLLVLFGLGLLLLFLDRQGLLLFFFLRSDWAFFTASCCCLSAF